MHNEIGEKSIKKIKAQKSNNHDSMRKYNKSTYFNNFLPMKMQE